MRTARLLTGDLGDAEDLIQTALAKTWPRWEAIGSASAARETYVRRVLVTTFLAWRRRPWALPTRTGDLPDDAEATNDIRRADMRDALIRELADCLLGSVP